MVVEEELGRTRHSIVLVLDLAVQEVGLRICQPLQSAEAP